MIKLTVHDPKKHHFSIEADEPVLIEVHNFMGVPLAVVYKGHDAEREVGCYDGSIGAENTGWTYPWEERVVG